MATNAPTLNPKTNTFTQTNLVASTNRVISPLAPKTANAPHPLPSVTLRPSELQPGWVEMGRWSTATKKASLRQTASGYYPEYRLETPRGAIDFTIKNQIARWNGLAFMLSFAPLSDHGKPFIHSLDLENTFIPLLENARCELRNKIVVIDPGHGGDQSGTRSISGNHYEKEFTLDWALRAQGLLTNEGWTVVLTRTNDVDIPLTNRVAKADNAHADLFISLHFNSLASSEQSGLETYCLTPAGMPSNLVRGFEDNLPQPNNAFDTENLAWAMRLHRQLVLITHSADRGVRRARFPAVLKTQKRPAVLIEGGYLSNRKEADLISTPAYRQKLAEAVVRAILKP